MEIEVNGCLKNMSHRSNVGQGSLNAWDDQPVSTLRRLYSPLLGEENNEDEQGRESDVVEKRNQLFDFFGFFRSTDTDRQSESGISKRSVDYAILKKFRMPLKVDAAKYGPKVFFSTERTFLAWLSLSVTIASISALVLAFANAKNPFSNLYAIMLLTISICFSAYALIVFSSRFSMLSKRSFLGAFDDRFGPIALAIMIAGVISTAFITTIYGMIYF